MTEDRATKRYIEWAILTTRLIELYYINGIIWFWINFFSTFPFYLGWSAQVTYDSFRYTLTYMHNMRIFSFCNGIQNICCISRIFFFWFVSSWMSKLIKIPIIRTYNTYSGLSQWSNRKTRIETINLLHSDYKHSAVWSGMKKGKGRGVDEERERCHQNWFNSTYIKRTCHSVLSTVPSVHYNE